MSSLHSPLERGQTIVVVALVLVALLLFLALTVDGGNLYVHRRMAQNASDAAALQGASAMLAPGTTEQQILDVIGRMARENGVEPGEAGGELHAWFVDANGSRLSESEIGTWGWVPGCSQGALGVEVSVTTRFAGFFPGLLGAQALAASADSGAVAVFPRFCSDWLAYADCPSCGPEALALSGGTKTLLDGGLHSNSGLSVSADGVSQSPQWAERAPAGECLDTTGVLCPPGGYAATMPPVAMPALYRYEDFLPGGSWWNDMCAGDAPRCYRELPHGLLAGGLYVVDGDLNLTGASFDALHTHYTFVATGNITLSAGHPLLEPYVGSSALGGSKLLMMSRNGAVLMGDGSHAWDGVIFAPHGRAAVSGSPARVTHGMVFAWTVALAGPAATFQHDPYYCPPEQARITLLW